MSKLWRQIFKYLELLLAHYIIAQTGVLAYWRNWRIGGNWPIGVLTYIYYIINYIVVLGLIETF